MKVIGITGGIATGKSIVTESILKLGYKVIDCDKIAHQLLDDEKIILKLKVLFGNEIISNGKINRNALGAIIFNHPVEQKRLNNLIHPLVITEVKAKLKVLKEDIVFIDCPLLYEAKMEVLMDKVIVVYVDEDIQIQRLMKRDNINYDYAKKKVKSQMPIKEKVKLADYLINNGGELKSTLLQLHEIIRRIKDEI